MKKLISLLCLTAMLTGCGVEGKSSEADSGKSTVSEKEEVTATEEASGTELATEITTAKAPEAETTTQIITTEAPEPETEKITEENVNAMTYRTVLERIYYGMTLPDGEELEGDLGGNISENTFAIHDVDGDGRDELIFMYTNATMASMFGVIYDHDEDGNIVKQLHSFPAMRFYSNGVIEADSSHNHGLSGSFWPYTLYKYNSGTDTYVRVAYLEAMEKKMVDEINENSADYGIAPPYVYPEEADTSGTGTVYYIHTEGYSEFTQPVDVTEYEKWYDGYISGAEQFEVPFMNLTEENIKKVNQ